MKQHQPAAEIAAGNPWYLADQFRAQMGSRGRRRVIENRWRVFARMIAGWRGEAGAGHALRLLDAGCGDGINLVGLPEIGALAGVTFAPAGVDYNPVRLRRARAIEPRAHLQQASLYDLPFADSAFDLVLCNHVIEHVPHADRACRELSRVLRPGGLLIVGVPNEGCAMARLRNHVVQRSIARETDHLHFFTGRSLQELLGGAGLVVRAVEGETFFFPHSYLNAGLNELTAGHWLMAALRRVFPSQAGGLIVSAIKPAQEQGT
jgi:SAM-dependent methyltransferase